MTSFTPLSALLGGALIGGSASLLLLFNGRVAGVSGIVAGLFSADAAERGYRLSFVLGLLLGGALLLAASPTAFGHSMPALPLMATSGVLVGVGARLGSGCTSGHGVCGIARASRRSLVATITFMLAGALVASLVARGG